MFSQACGMLDLCCLVLLSVHDSPYKASCISSAGVTVLCLVSKCRSLLCSFISRVMTFTLFLCILQANRAHTYLGKPGGDWHISKDEADIYPDFPMVRAQDLPVDWPA